MVKEDQKKFRSSVVEKIVSLEPGKYGDGHPLDHIKYLECKVILKGNWFTSVQSFHEFAELVGKAAAKTKVNFDKAGFQTVRPRIREVLFLDTKDFKLYNNAFILRRRTAMEDGFFVGDPEVVFKYRHSDLQTAADMDVRPNVQGGYKIKFKAEMLPKKEELGGYRMLYSHNAQFPLSRLQQDDRSSLSTLVEVFPALQKLEAAAHEHVEFVNHGAVTEVLLDLGILNFGKGIEPKADISVWRSRGDQKQLVGEFAYQCKFEKGNDLHDKAVIRCREFFCELQHVASDWIELGMTKTAAVYRLKGTPPNSHE